MNKSAKKSILSKQEEFATKNDHGANKPLDDEALTQIKDMSSLKMLYRKLRTKYENHK